MRNYGNLQAFTLIELLIVVLIIAILAAIAVPNFLEFQTRAKTSRTASDMRSIRVAIEAYQVDNNEYPETDFGVGSVTQPGAGPLRLTTPIAYMSSLPLSPFQEDKMGFAGSPKLSNTLGVYLYVRAKMPNGSFSGVVDNSPADGLDDSYNLDRAVYLGQGDLATVQLQRSAGRWMLKSVGPNNEDDRQTLGNNARLYDPTNGTISAGDLVVFNDTQGFKTR